MSQTIRFVKFQSDQGLWNTLPFAQKILELEHIVLEGRDLLRDNDKFCVALGTMRQINVMWSERRVTRLIKQRDILCIYIPL